MHYVLLVFMKILEQNSRISWEGKNPVNKASNTSPGSIKLLKARKKWTIICSLMGRLEPQSLKYHLYFEVTPMTLFSLFRLLLVNSVSLQSNLFFTTERFFKTWSQLNRTKSSLKTMSVFVIHFFLLEKFLEKFKISFCFQMIKKKIC